MKPPRTDDVILPCTVAPDAYYPTQGGGRETRIARWLCARCPVQERCADWAIRHEAHGTWAGLSENERAAIRARRHIVLTSPPSLTGDPRRTA